jgi:hypothetical protein
VQELERVLRQSSLEAQFHLLHPCQKPAAKVGCTHTPLLIAVTMTQNFRINILLHMRLWLTFT